MVSFKHKHGGVLPPPTTKGENTMTNTLFAYGLSHRGCSIGTQPNGFDHFEDTDKATTGFYSIVYYAEELTADQITEILSLPRSPRK